MEEPIESARKLNVYVVGAYRWGRINEHNYIVTATADRAEAIAAAKEECDGRGLKYGVDVVEYPSEETVAYFPSSAEANDAAGPVYSDDLAASNHVGSNIVARFQGGPTWLSNGTVDTVKDAPAEFPAWLAMMCQEALNMFRRK